MGWVIGLVCGVGHWEVILRINTSPCDPTLTPTHSAGS
nr:MAG TPA: hypothetical protein [Caudoviricetes sp.]